MVPVQFGHVGIVVLVDVHRQGGRGILCACRKLRWLNGSVSKSWREKQFLLIIEPYPPPAHGILAVCLWSGSPAEASPCNRSVWKFHNVRAARTQVSYICD